jgi:predicted Na+-dependent transporter
VENLPFRESDLASFAGLAIVIPLVIGAVKKLFPAWIAGKEPMLALVAAYVIGFTAKLTIPHAFGSVGWLTLGIGLLLVAVAAAGIHDTIINRVIKGKDGGSA